jgi:hypothetical protein
MRVSVGVCGWSVGGLWVYGLFELWLSRYRVVGVGVGGTRCRGVGVCRSIESQICRSTAQHFISSRIR